MKIISNIKKYLSEVWTELKKVVWPTRREAFYMTVIVIAFSAAIAAFLGLADYVIAKLLELIIK